MIHLRGLIVIAGCLAIMVLLSRAALPHSFYDQSCCHDRDCAPLPDKDTPKPLPGGDWLLTTGEIVERARVKWAPDGRYHLCRSQITPSHIFCLYVPPQGS